MTQNRCMFVVCCLALMAMPRRPASAHATGTEARTPSECNVMTGSQLSGPRGECLRCIARSHYHYHSDLPRRQRCHRENRQPPGTARRR